MPFGPAQYQLSVLHFADPHHPHPSSGLNTSGLNLSNLRVAFFIDWRFPCAAHNISIQACTAPYTLGTPSLLREYGEYIHLRLGLPPRVL